MIVIPMAGLSRRFADAGYRQPKYMLNLGGRTVFAHAVSSFNRYFGSESFLFVARDIQDTRGFLGQQIAELGLGRAQVAMLDAPTGGQAETVRLGLEQVGTSPDEPLTIFNIDTFRPGYAYPEAAWFDYADGYLEVMPGSDPGYSYALASADDAQRVVRTAEKEVISGLASTGLYWFRRSAEFLRALDEVPAHESGESYIAPLYNQLIGRGQSVYCHKVPGSAVIFCGIPAQYEALVTAEHE